MNSYTDLFGVCLGVHGEFDRGVWGGRGSFHNVRHVETNVRAGLMLVDAAEKGVDPVGIREGLKKLVGSTPTGSSRRPVYNRTPQDDSDLFERLRRCLRLAFGMHDLGNILRVSKQSKRGMQGTQGTESNDERIIHGVNRQYRSGVLAELGVEFLPGYRAVGAEGRSLEVGRRLMEWFGVEEQDRELVEYLMGETSFVLDDREKPLALLMRACDQLSNGCFIRENLAYRLMLEWADEDSNKKVRISEQVNFTPRRIKELIPDEGDRQSLLRIWGAEIPAEIDGLPSELMTVSEAVEWMESQGRERGILGEV